MGCLGNPRGDPARSGGGSGSLEPLHNAIDLAELAAEKGVQTLVMPVSCRRQLNEMSDDLAARLAVSYYTDARDALLKALGD